MRTPWTEQEIEKLKEVYATHSQVETAELLGRSWFSIQNKVKKLGLKKENYKKYNSRMWSENDKDYLIRYWGIISQKTIAQNLGRSVSAVRKNASILQLGAFLKGSTYITLRELFSALGKGYEPEERYLKSWIKKGFPVQKIHVNNGVFKVIYLNSFWVWAEKNRSNIDFSKMPKFILGEEPEWVDQQRKADVARADRFKRRVIWTEEEDKRLKYYVNQFKYSSYEFEQIFGRNIVAINLRLKQLGVKSRPLEADNSIKWTQEETSLLIQHLSLGMSYEMITVNFKKSSTSLRNKAQQIFGTKKIDDIQRMINLHGQERYLPKKDNTG